LEEKLDLADYQLFSTGVKVSFGPFSLEARQPAAAIIMR
jgi:hypothetical protein